jgi:hypothetical protein
MSRIERRIAMIQDTLKNGELAPEQAVRLTTELNDLLSMADTDTFVDAMQRSREVAQSKNETKPLQPRGRKPRAAYVTGTADRVTPQGPVDVKTAAVTDFATSLKAATGAVSVTVNDDPVTVTVGEVKPVTFKRLYNNSWGIAGPVDVMKPGAKVNVLKRDGSTTEVTVGNLLGKPSKDGNQLAYIDYSAKAGAR